MTNSILDVLTYMFDYIFESADYGSSSSEIDDASLKAHLSEAGFDNARIDKALLWLENIAAAQLWSHAELHLIDPCFPRTIENL